MTYQVEPALNLPAAAANQGNRTAPGGGSLDKFNSAGKAPGRPKFDYSVEGYAYHKEELNIKYQNKDGDFLELTYNSESVHGFKADAAGNTEEDRKYFKELLEQLRDFIMEQERRLLESIFGEGWENGEKTVQTAEGTESSSELNIPEYWNAENTSQRIVDFATSFFEISGKDAEEFGKVIIDAVKKGFEEANEILGNSLPGPVAELISDTQRLTLEKLDAWVAENSQPELAAAA